jgi:hypothetical protein
MQHFDRGERRLQTERLKNTRKNYFNVWDHGDPKQLGRITQYPCMCSGPCCSPTAYRRLYGNALRGLKATEQSALQLLCKEH